MTKMMKKRIHRCSMCDNDAKWYYMPHTNGRRYYCDNHVPRGCSCNKYSIHEFGEPETSQKFYWCNKEETIYEYLDDNNLPYPCCEFDYEENGQEFIEPVYVIDKEIVVSIYNDTKHKLKDDIKMMQSIESFINSIGNKYLVYNRFMKRISEITQHWCKGFMNNGQHIVNFYNSFREQCYRQRKAIWSYGEEEEN